MAATYAPLGRQLIRSRTQHLGTVVAATEKEAIREAIKQFEIEPARQNRITVTRISKAKINAGAIAPMQAPAVPPMTLGNMRELGVLLRTVRPCRGS
jgi:hypothetical protein